jgi:small subunit ribosomal protein S3
MGHKIHPTGFRIGVIYGWQSRWYSDRNYTRLLHEDLRIRRRILTGLGDAGISKVDIDRSANELTVTIHTAKPGIVIGRQGAKVEELRTNLTRLTNRKVRVNIQEIRIPEMDAYLVARSIADQLQRRIAFRRAMKQGVQRTMQRGAKGIKVIVAGRLGGSEMGRREQEKEGRVPLHTLRADIDYGFAEARTTYGMIGVKVWIYKGEILPEPKKVKEVAEAPVEAAPALPEGTIVPSATAAVATAPVEAPAAAVAEVEPAPAPAMPEPTPAAAAAAPEAVAAAPATETAPNPMAELARMQEQMRQMQAEMARLQAAAAAAIGAPPAAAQAPESAPSERGVEQSSQPEPEGAIDQPENGPEA